MNEWNIDKSAELYGIDVWSAGYFRINAKGNMEVAPLGAEGPKVDLFDLTNDLRERGIRVPLLLRFTEILRSRIELISSCFSKAIRDHNYQGSYRGVYPIKVNQQRHLVEDLIRFGSDHNLGLECGSKPELLIVLAMEQSPQALIICNGFKDLEYIETAILSQKLGRNTIIVVDRLSELPMIVQTAKKFEMRPRIGFRAKLYSKGSGKWMDSSGAHSKFGLTPPELVRGINMLKEHNLVDCLELFHFHIGSQINDIRCIKSSLKEGLRYYTELCALGASPKYLDVGGGLGVDYDGSKVSHSSINYTEQEYANDVVSVVQEMCDEKGIPHPDVITESGRALTAFSSVLVFDVRGVNKVRYDNNQIVEKNDHQILRDLKYIYDNLTQENLNEFFNDLMQAKADFLQMFNYGVLRLEDRAKAENLFWSIATRMASMARQSEENQEMLNELEEMLCDTYFCNFSIFQSAPDAWAVQQVFPVNPIHRLNEEPDRLASLADLTCDSDGKIGQFINFSNGKKKKTLEVHSMRDDETYFIGMFLVGAYQEILGDMHNLFGDTDIVHISVNESGYSVDHVIRGDSVREMLTYVEYDPEKMLESVRRASEQTIFNGNISKLESRLLMKHYEEGLNGYTYLEDPE